MPLIVDLVGTLESTRCYIESTRWYVVLFMGTAMLLLLLALLPRSLDCYAAASLLLEM